MTSTVDKKKAELTQKAAERLTAATKSGKPLQREAEQAKLLQQAGELLLGMVEDQAVQQAKELKAAISDALALQKVAEEKVALAQRDGANADAQACDTQATALRVAASVKKVLAMAAFESVFGAIFAAGLTAMALALEGEASKKELEKKKKLQVAEAQDKKADASRSEAASAAIDASIQRAEAQTAGERAAEQAAAAAAATAEAA